MGGLPGEVRRVRAMVSAGAPARETSSSNASNTAAGGSAMRSRKVALPRIDWAIAEVAIKVRSATSAARDTHLVNVISDIAHFSTSDFIVPALGRSQRGVGTGQIGRA